MPVGAYASRSEIMSHISPEGNVYQAGTLSGNPVAMAAGIAQLSECLQPAFYAYLERKTKMFIESILTAIPISKQKEMGLKIISIESIFWIAFTEKETLRAAEEINPHSMNLFRKAYHLLLEKGVYLGPSGYEVGFVSAAHTEEDLKKAAAIIAEVLQLI
jgi:glutamate-1-semialdehyde 2,1-aminomutase